MSGMDYRLPPEKQARYEEILAAGADLKGELGLVRLVCEELARNGAQPIATVQVAVAAGRLAQQNQQMAIQRREYVPLADLAKLAQIMGRACYESCLALTGDEDLSCRIIDVVAKRLAAIISRYQQTGTIADTEPAVLPAPETGPSLPGQLGGADF